MTLALMRCCATTPLLAQYETATDSVLTRLGIGVVPVEFNCCGYPLRNAHFAAYVRSSARNLALAERASADVLTLCACCYGTMRHVDHLMKGDAALRAATNTALSDERLHCSGSAKVRHLLQVLRDDVGLERIRSERRRTFEGLKVACHYGCHLLRPSDVAQLDDPTSPTVLDALVEATGAESVPWAAKLDCCGSPVWGVNDELSGRLTERKLRSASEAGAEALCVVCPYCHVQLDRVGRRLAAERDVPQLPIVLFHQLLGLSLGLAPEALGLDPDRLPVRGRDVPDGNGARHA